MSITLSKADTKTDWMGSRLLNPLVLLEYIHFDIIRPSNIEGADRIEATILVSNEAAGCCEYKLPQHSLCGTHIISFCKSMSKYIGQEIISNGAVTVKEPPIEPLIEEASKNLK